MPFEQVTWMWWMDLNNCLTDPCKEICFVMQLRVSATVGWHWSYNNSASVLNINWKYWFVWCVKKGFPHEEGSTTSNYYCYYCHIWQKTALSVGYITNNFLFTISNEFDKVTTNCHKYQSYVWEVRCFTNWTKTNWQRMYRWELYITMRHLS